VSVFEADDTPSASGEDDCLYLLEATCGEPVAELVPELGGVQRFDRLPLSLLATYETGGSKDLEATPFASEEDLILLCTCGEFVGVKKLDTLLARFDT
jgi:hypothetical protein